MRAVAGMVFGMWLLCAASGSGAVAQQVADTAFFAEIPHPEYRLGTGPVVLIDEAHNNYHTAAGRYLAFATLLRRDGYVVRPFTQLFTLESLSEGDILVVANGLHERNVDDWSLPTLPAFTMDEVTAVREWVEAGGALMLVADHMPMPGAAAALAAEFDVEFLNGFAFESLTDTDGPMIFRRSDGSLRPHPTSDGRDPSERIDSVASFTGQAFWTGANVTPIMVFRSEAVSFNPRVAWEFTESTERVGVGGWAQGALADFGAGRVALFGEAAMFTAQLSVSQAGSFPMGMNRPEASQNQQFLLNVVHWLSPAGRR